ncbi:MAG: class I SAM-dependent methyltransferase [Planctomycetes bacterium]|nr:class I SAM-dependent methyltransferase [Planctomycetota bacterium]
MTGPDAYRSAMARRLLRRGMASGQIRLPAVPALLDDYQILCERSFAVLGVAFDADQRARLRSVLEGQLAAAYAASPRSEIVIAYDSPVGFTVNYTVTPLTPSLGEVYDAWVTTREPPYFGTTADARVTAVAAEAGPPDACPVLDIGAGTGRNAVALARHGHPVDAVELSGRFATLLHEETTREHLPVRVIDRNVFASLDDLRRDYGLIALSEVTPDFRTTAELRRMFEIAAACLAPGGRLVFNVFLPQVGYTPDAAARELGLQVYTSIFTYPEVAAAASGLPLALEADDSVHDYEQQHLPAGAWPPTRWYADWVSGLDVFDMPRHESPIEMRWLVFRRAVA